MSENSTNSLVFPIVSCPHCGAGSSDMTNKINMAGMWGKVQCHACNEDFEVISAIDEMFIGSSFSGYSLWTGGTQIYRPIVCESGKAHLVDIKGIFEEVYVTFPLFSSPKYLSGGFVTKYIPQGYAMVAIAPNPDGEIVTMKGNLLIEGRTEKQPKMETWKKMLLDAKLAIYDSPHLTIVLALNAVDLYLEKIAKVSQDDLSNRPMSWHKIINEHFGIKLKKILGKYSKQIQQLVDLRNAIAHGSNHLEALPDELQKSEEHWIENGKYYEGHGAVAPSAKFALRSAFKIIRICERINNKGNYVPVFKQEIA